MTLLLNNKEDSAEVFTVGNKKIRSDSLAVIDDIPKVLSEKVGPFLLDKLIELVSSFSNLILQFLNVRVNSFHSLYIIILVC